MNQRGKRSRIPVIAIVALAGAGAWISGEQVKQHAGLWRGDNAGGGFFADMCEAVGRVGFDCVGAQDSKWSRIEVPLPGLSPDFQITRRVVRIPVAFLGLAYFVFMGVWFAFVGGPRRYGGAWHRVPLVVGTCGLVASVFYVGVMVAGLAPRCLGCVAVHAVNFLLVFVMWLLGSRKEAAGQPEDGAVLVRQVARAMLTSREATSVMAFALIIIAGLWGYRREKILMAAQLGKLVPHKELVSSLRENPKFLLREYLAQPTVVIPQRPSEDSEGELPRLVMFTDYECPACYCNSLAVRKQVADTFGDDLAIEIRHLPLCSDCNDSVETTGHPNACDAAYAAEAARLVGGEGAFRQMHELLFENRGKLRRGIYAGLASEAGLDPQRFLNEMSGEAVRRTVSSDIALAGRLGVRGTPTMFLNGRRLNRLLGGPVFWRAVADSWKPDSGDGRMAAASSEDQTSGGAAAERALE